MSIIVIVGGGGFIGRHVSDSLSSSGYHIYATCRAQRANLSKRDIHWLPGDLANDSVTINWPKKCDHLVYLAQSRLWRDFPDKAKDVFDVNVVGLMRAVDYARRAGARQIIYASTGSVYPQSNKPASESDPIDLHAPRRFYAASKIIGELLLKAYESHLRILCLRLFMPYGAGQSSDMLLPTLVRSMREGRSIKLHCPDGLIANPVAVSDVVETIRRCLDLDYSATLNVAGPQQLSLRRMSSIIGHVFGGSPVFEDQPGTPPVIVGDCTALQSALAWAPHTDLESGLRQWRESEMIPTLQAG